MFSFLMDEKRRPAVARSVSDDTKQRIGEVLKHLRQEKLWSQAELAHRIGTTPVSVGRWENNITRPNLHFQQQLCEVFARSPEELGFVSQAEPEHSASAEYPDQPQQAESGQPAPAAPDESGSDGHLLLAPVSSIPRPRELLSRRDMLRRRRLLLAVLICLSLCFLLSTLFWSVKQFTLASPVHRPSCQTPSSQESAATIYAQVTCKQAKFSVALDRQDELRWDENSQCGFRQGAYHVLLPASAYVAECFAHAASFGPNFALQADITVLKGYSGGLVFRAEGPSSNWDVITSRVPVDIWGQYNFDLANTNIPCHLTKDSSAPNYCYAPHGTITYGTGVTNTIMIIALGSRVYIYVNGFFIDQAQAPASSPLTGFLGVFANGSQTTADVAFRHFQIWNI